MEEIVIFMHRLKMWRRCVAWISQVTMTLMQKKCVVRAEVEDQVDTKQSISVLYCRFLKRRLYQLNTKLQSLNCLKEHASIFTIIKQTQRDMVVIHIRINLDAENTMIEISIQSKCVAIVEEGEQVIAFVKYIILEGFQ